jgi:PIN domain nuclease of toxin-antitoxin system
VLRSVADTHTVIWYIFRDVRLSATARNTIEQIAAEGNQVAFSSITLAEIVYLSERGRIDAATLDRLLRAIDSENALLVEIPFDRNIAQALMRLNDHRFPICPIALLLLRLCILVCLSSAVIAGFNYQM